MKKFVIEHIELVIFFIALMFLGEIQLDVTFHQSTINWWNDVVSTVTTKGLGFELFTFLALFISLLSHRVYDAKKPFIVTLTWGSLNASRVMQQVGLLITSLFLNVYLLNRLVVFEILIIWIILDLCIQSLAFILVLYQTQRQSRKI